MSTAADDVWALRRGDPAYPSGLEALEGNAPATLFCRGSREVVAGLDPSATVTIVGSRRATACGLGVAEDLGRLLAAAGLAVVSGMALGIDSAAHRGALDGDGVTVAVLAGGPDVVYPPSGRRLYDRILEAGAVVSEAPPGASPRPHWFPERNRLMAALAGITVVVEAAEPSGSLVTARRAVELGREVGAVPGRVTSRVSEGTNGLLADGAKVIRGAQDVLDQLLGVGAATVTPRGPALDPDLAAILGAVEAGASTSDAVSTASGLEPGAVAVGLARLELMGYLQADPSGRYVRTSLLAPSPEVSAHLG